MKLATRLARFLGLLEPAEMPADDHLRVAERTADAGECDRVTPAAPKPDEPSPDQVRRIAEPRPKRAQHRIPYRPPAPHIGDATPSLRSTLAVELGSQLTADQSLWAPHMLTEAERRQANHILRRYR